MWPFTTQTMHKSKTVSSLFFLITSLMSDRWGRRFIFTRRVTQGLAVRLSCPYRWESTGSEAGPRSGPASLTAPRRRGLAGAPRRQRPTNYTSFGKSTSGTSGRDGAGHKEPGRGRRRWGVKRSAGRRDPARPGPAALLTPALPLRTTLPMVHCVGRGDRACAGQRARILRASRSGGFVSGPRSRGRVGSAGGFRVAGLLYVPRPRPGGDGRGRAAHCGLRHWPHQGTGCGGPGVRSCPASSPGGGCAGPGAGRAPSPAPYPPPPTPLPGPTTASPDLPEAPEASRGAESCLWGRCAGGCLRTGGRVPAAGAGARADQAARLVFSCVSGSRVVMSSKGLSLQVLW